MENLLKLTKLKIQSAVLLCGLMAVLLFFQNCDTIKVSHFASNMINREIVEAKLISGTFCHPNDKNLVSAYRLSDFYAINLTAGKFDGVLFPDNDLDGTLDKTDGFSGKGSVEVSNLDSDEDGIPDFVEKLKGLNPNSADANSDGVDLDGILNRREIQLGTDPNHKGDEPAISYTVKVSDVTAGCGAGQQAYHYDIDRILLAPTKKFTDTVNNPPYLLSHEDDENVILVLAKMSPEDTKKNSVYIAKIFKLNAKNLVAVNYTPPEYYILGEAVDNCPSCNAGGGGVIYSKIFAGPQHACAISNTNSGICWGNNLSGQLGDGTNTSRVGPIKIKLTEAVNQMAIGKAHTCALTLAQDVYCWGANNYGQLGNNTSIDSMLPIKVNLGTDKAMLISAGSGHTCAVLQNSTIKCWGRNDLYQLANASTTASLTPTLAVVTGVQFPIVQLNAAANNTCMTGANGVAYCWGKVGSCLQNSIQRVPTNCSATQTFPAEGIRLTSAWKMMVTNGTVNSGVDSTSLGRLTCWGQSIYAYGNWGSGCGDQADGGVQSDPIGNSAEFTVSIGRVLKIAMGINHSCGVWQKLSSTGLLTNALDCWGENGVGALAQPLSTPTPNIVPMTVSEVKEPKDVATGDGFSCAIDKDGIIWCWGINTFGQLASGDILNSSVPAKIKNQ